MPTLAERFIEKRSKISERLKKIKDKLADEEEYTSSNDLKDVPIIFIGDHSFRNNEIVTLFAPDNRKEETLELFKKVFQNKYPITRHNGIPRVPSREEDKNLIVDGLNKYFNLLRNEIISLKKKGDSVDLREKISHLQKINILITHFKEDKETFPYQNFKDYLSNKEFVDSVGDIDEGLKYVKGDEEEEKRVRNLLRQFIKVYLQNKSAQDFSVHGDGIFSDQFKEFKKDYEEDNEKKGKIPQVLIYLMEILEGERMKVPEKSEYDFTQIYTLLESLRNKFADAEEAKDPQFPTQDGGKIPDVKREKLEDTIQEVVDYMIEEYIKLKAGYDSVLRESLSKDSKIASLRNRISIDQDLKKQATNELKTSKEIINELNKKISEYIRELAKKNKIIEGLLKKCKEKKMRDDNRNSNLPYDRLIDIFGKNYNEFEEENLKRALLNEIRGYKRPSPNRNIPERGRLLPGISNASSLILRKTPTLQKDDNNSNDGFIRNVAKSPLFKRKQRNQVITFLLKDKDKNNNNLDEIINFIKTNDNNASIKKLQLLLDDNYMNTVNKEVLEKLIKMLREGVRVSRNKEDIIRSLEDEMTYDYDSENDDNPNIAREIVSNIASLPSPERIELIEEIRNSPSIDNSVNILKDFYKKQQFIDQDWSPEIFDSVIKELIERLKTARDTKAADKIFTEPQFRIRVGKREDSEYYSAKHNERMKEQEKIKQLEKNNNINNSYSRFRGMFDPEFEEEPKKSSTLPAPSTPSTPSAREDPQTEWIVENVRGDGNCFYRALYNAALRYYGGSIVSDIYECFGIYNGVEDEEQFIRSMRNSIGDKILNGIYDQKAAANTNGDNQGIYEILHDGALADVNGTNPKSGNVGTFVGMFSALRQGFSREIKDKYPNAETMAKETKENFYKFLSDTVKRDKVYASEYDIDLVKWILNKCNSPIYIYTESNENVEFKDNKEILTERNLNSIPKYRTLNGKRTINLLNIGEYHYKYFYEKIIPQGTPTMTLDKAFELLELDKDNLDILLLERRITNILNAINRKYQGKRSLNEKLYLAAKNLLIGYYERKFIDSPKFRDNNVTKDEFDTAIRILGLNGVNPLTHAMINKKYRQLARTKHTNKGGDTGEFQELENSKTLLLKLSEQQIQEYLNMQGGGSKESKLLEYSRKVADNRLKEFLKEEPLPLFTLIEEFENSSNLKVIEKGNEKHIFETFLNYMFEQHFSSEEGKQFYFEAYEILNKKKYFEIAILCFVILENINAIQSSRKDIDTVRMSSSEYNAMFDEFEQNLKEANYDFFTEASKLVPNTMSIKFFQDHIYFHNNTDSFEKTFTINNNLDIDKEHYDFNEELYFVNNSTIYLFFIISSYLYMKPNVKLSLEDSINKFSRKMKRTKNKKTKSIGLLLKERKEFNNEELDGEED